MKQRLAKHRIWTLVLALCLLLPLMACGSQEILTPPSPRDTLPETDGAARPDLPGEDNFYDEDTPPEDNIAQDRKLTRTIDLRMETKSYSELSAKIESEVLMAGGYVQTSAISGDETSGTRTATYVLRIPADKLDTFLSEISTGGNVISQSSKTEDITLRYIDTESRLAALRVEQEAMMGILERAETIEEIITIQDRLTNIRYEIETHEAQKRSMDNLVTYSLVNISLREVRDFTPAEQEGFFSEAGRRFIQAWQAFVVGIQWLLLQIISILPFLLILLVLVFVSIWLIKRAGKNNRRKRLERQKALQTTNPPEPQPGAPHDRDSESP